MATTEDVKKLAALARIKLADAELVKFTSEFDTILGYVGQLEKLNFSQDVNGKKPPLRNIMRADGEPHAPDAYTEKLAEQFSAREGNALRVKQIIQHD